MTDTIVFHLSAVVLARAGILAPDADARTVTTQAEHAYGAALADVERLRDGFDRVVVVVPVWGRPFRAELAAAWSRERDEGGEQSRSIELWRALSAVAAELGRRECIVFTPPAYGANASALDVRLDGLVPSSRDAIATIARLHRETADGSRLSIVSSRQSVAALLCPEHSIDVWIFEADTWRCIDDAADLAAWKRWPPIAKKDWSPPAGVRVPRALLPDWTALEALPGIGQGTALALLHDGQRWREGGALAVVQKALDGWNPRGKSGRELRVVGDTLRRLGEAGMMRALAVATLREDVDVSALGARKESDDGRKSDGAYGGIGASERSGDGDRHRDADGGGAEGPAGLHRAPGWHGGSAAPREPESAPYRDHRSGNDRGGGRHDGFLTDSQAGPPTPGPGRSDASPNKTLAEPDETPGKGAHAAPQADASAPHGGYMPRTSAGPSPPLPVGIAGRGGAADGHQQTSNREDETMTTTMPTTAAETTAETQPAPEDAQPAAAPEAPEDSARRLAEPEFAATAPPAPSEALTLDPSDPRWALALQPTSARDAMILATVIFKSGMFPKSKYPNRDMIFAVIQMGREHGISALLALQSMHVIDGKVEMSADLIAALVLRSGKAKRFACVETTDEIAVYEAQRHDDPAPMRITFTKKNAQDRGLWGKGNWTKMPDVMLAHRACTKAARLKFPEVTVGLYGQGEIRETRLADVDEGLDAAAEAAIAARDARGRAA